MTIFNIICLVILLMSVLAGLYSLTEFLIHPKETLPTTNNNNLAELNRWAVELNDLKSPFVKPFDLLSAGFSACPFGILITDEVGNLVFLNSKAKCHISTDLQKIRENHGKEFRSCFSRTNVKKSIKNVVDKTLTTNAAASEILHTTGKIKNISVETFPIFKDKAVPIGTISVVNFNDQGNK